VTPLLPARLDKSGSRILCASLSCGEEIATIYIDPDGHRFIQFAPEWRFSEDYDAWRKGKRPPRRKKLLNETTQIGWDDTGRSVRTYLAHLVQVLPTRAVCPGPNCRGRRLLLLEADRLAVVPADLGPLWHLNPSYDADPRFGLTVPTWD
jgi:hypothetical protein